MSKKGIPLMVITNLITLICWYISGIGTGVVGALAEDTWTAVNVPNVRSVQFVIEKNEATSDAHEQFNYINLRVR